jgi:hypothetical protein
MMVMDIYLWEGTRRLRIEALIKNNRFWSLCLQRLKDGSCRWWMEKNERDVDKKVKYGESRRESGVTFLKVGYGGPQNWELMPAFKSGLRFTRQTLSCLRFLCVHRACWRKLATYEPSSSWHVARLGRSDRFWTKNKALLYLFPKLAATTPTTSITYHRSQIYWSSTIHPRE